MGILTIDNLLYKASVRKLLEKAGVFYFIICRSACDCHAIVLLKFITLTSLWNTIDGQCSMYVYVSQIIIINIMIVE